MIAFPKQLACSAVISGSARGDYWRAAVNQGIPNPQITQRAIREVVGVIRQWYLTICHDLCIEPPKIRIRQAMHEPTYNICPDGCYEHREDTVTLYVVGEDIAEQYLLTLAHELRHAHQFHNGVAPTERDAEEYERYFVGRFRHGPEAGSYRGPIDGLIRVVKCAQCHNRIDPAQGAICNHCMAQVSRTRRAPAAGHDRDRTNRKLCDGCGKPIRHSEGALCDACRKSSAKLPMAARLKSAYEQRRRDKQQRRTNEVLMYRINNIDNHPANGQPGWWLIEDSYYAFAASAGEAIIKVSNQPLSDCPALQFLGPNLPAHIRRVAVRGDF